MKKAAYYCSQLLCYFCTVDVNCPVLLLTPVVVKIVSRDGVSVICILL